MRQWLLLKRHFLLSYSHTGLVDDGLTGSGLLSRWIDKAVWKIKAKWNITSQKGASSRGTAERTLSIDPFMYSFKSFKTSVTMPDSLDAEKQPTIVSTSRKQHLEKEEENESQELCVWLRVLVLWDKQAAEPPPGIVKTFASTKKKHVQSKAVHIGKPVMAWTECASTRRMCGFL